MYELGKRFSGIAAIGLIAVSTIVFAGASGTIAAEPAILEGSWSGGGKVQFPSGSTENARCRASFRKRGGNNYVMSAVCATPSTRVEQTATLERTGANRFSGDFQNAEFSISGSINITVRGNALSASLNGGGASASFNLSR